MEETVIGNIKTVSSDEAFGIKSENSPFALNFYFDDYYDDKAVKNFIKRTERLIRSSKEYENYISLLRTNIIALNHDNILHNINDTDASLEFHHYPLSLYDIIEIIMGDHVIQKINFTSFSLAKEVMDCHYKHIIGLVSLSKTTHELAHSGNLFISKSQVFGNYEKFLDIYKKGLSFDIKEKIKNFEDLDAINIASDFKGLLS